MDKERLKQIGNFLNYRIIVHRNVENDTNWTTEEKMIQELYDSYLDLLIKYKKRKEVIDKAIKLIKYNERYRDGADCCQFVDIVSEILDPLQSILEQDETTNNAYLKEFEDWLNEVSE